MNLYREESSTPKYNAQRNLNGRSHYVDDDTLRFHHSRVLSSGTTDGGLVFWLIESVAKDMRNTRRGFRYVAFDVFGNVVSKCDLDDCASSKETARKWMWVFLNGFDAYAHTLNAIDAQQRQFDAECSSLRHVVDQMKTKAA